MARSFLSNLAACFGQPVAENPTQVMMEAAFQQLGLNWRYLTIEVAPDNLADAIRGMRAMGFHGANCTLPHKVAVIAHLDQLSPTARVIGAVNCIVRRDNRLLGENTDGKGFLQSVSEHGPVAGKRAVLFGAGGAARAIGVELLLAGLGSLTIVNRGIERGEGLLAHLQKTAADRVRFMPWQGEFAIPENTDLVINSTNIGLFPNITQRVAVQASSLRPGMLVCDIIPNPPRTRFLAEAEEQGCRTLDGLGMLVNQGIIGIQLWTGQKPDPAVMRRALTEVFSEPG